jgi:hypothetical protein
MMVKAVCSLRRFPWVQEHLRRECTSRGLTLSSVLGDGIPRADLDILEQAVRENDLTTVVHVIAQIYGEGLSEFLSDELRDILYVYLKGKLLGLVRLDSNAYCNFQAVFQTLLRALTGIDRLDKFMTREGYFCRARLTEPEFVLVFHYPEPFGYDEVTELVRRDPQNQPAQVGAQAEVRLAIDDAVLNALRQAVEHTDIGEIVRTITQLYNEGLAGDLPGDLRDGVYNCLKGRLRELLNIDVWRYNELPVFRTLVRAVGRIGLYDELMIEEKALYATRVHPFEFDDAVITAWFDDEVEVFSVPSRFLDALSRAVEHTDIGEIVRTITQMYREGLSNRLPESLSGGVYRCLANKLHALVEIKRWVRDEHCVFMTLVRAVNRIGYYNILMEDEREFYVSKSIPTSYYGLENLIDDFDDMTEVGTNSR